MNNIVIVRGGGELATGTIQKLHNVGFKVLILEIEKPLTVRRTVSCSEAIYEGSIIIENFEVIKINNISDAQRVWDLGKVPIIVDEKADSIKKIKPFCVVDAIIAKKNIGTFITMAPVVIGIGPGFSAKEDVDIVIESNRGHDLGRLIFDGPAQENTGVPAPVDGYTLERVAFAENNGIVKNFYQIGDIVKVGDVVSIVGDKEVKAGLSGVIRGIIKNNIFVHKHTKLLDIDPRVELMKDKINLISDKARTIAGGVLEAILIKKRIGEKNEQNN